LLLLTALTGESRNNPIKGLNNARGYENLKKKMMQWFYTAKNIGVKLVKYIIINKSV